MSNLFMWYWKIHLCSQGLCNTDIILTIQSDVLLIYCKPGNQEDILHSPSYHTHTQLSIYLHFIRDARGHLQCSMGFYVLFKGITGENFRSNTSILQLPAHSQKTLLSVAGINPTTFRLLVSLYIQANLGRGAGWVVWDGSQMCVWWS